MRNKPLMFVLAGAILFGLIAAVSITQYIGGNKKDENLNTVLVAKMEIPIGASITPDALVAVQMPPEAIPDGAFKKMEEVTGRVAATMIAAREPVTLARLAPEGATAGLSGLIPPGYLAMTVRVDDEASLAGFLYPGTLVDVLAVISPTNSNEGPVSKIVLQNIKVLAHGQNLDRREDTRETEGVKSVTLLVLPEQSEKLVLASAEGRLRLALRNNVDQENRVTPGANRNSLLAGSRAMPVPEVAEKKSPAPVRRAVPRTVIASIDKIAPPPAPAPIPPRTTIEVFEGGKKQSVVFP
ncbi:MAG: Flp pilus assembly protein CpaB [Blastocatellia bacterium]|nr:Flp pilus assembly protein CpaB [Blastocatellia bacterium]